MLTICVHRCIIVTGGDFMLNRKEVAEYLKVHPNTVDRMVKKGMPALKFGGVVRFDLDAVIKWLEEQSKNKGE